MMPKILKTEWFTWNEYQSKKKQQKVKRNKWLEPK